MTLTRFVSEGNSINYLNTTEETILAGTPVLQNSLFAIPPNDIAPGELGSLNPRGIHELPKATGGSSGWEAGVEIWWVPSTELVAAVGTAEGAIAIGIAAYAAADADSVARVLIIPGFSVGGNGEEAEPEPSGE